MHHLSSINENLTCNLRSDSLYHGSKHSFGDRSLNALSHYHHGSCCHSLNCQGTLPQYTWEVKGCWRVLRKGALAIGIGQKLPRPCWDLIDIPITHLFCADYATDKRFHCPRFLFYSTSVPLLPIQTWCSNWLLAYMSCGNKQGISLRVSNVLTISNGSSQSLVPHHLHINMTTASSIYKEGTSETSDLVLSPHQWSYPS